MREPLKRQIAYDEDELTVTISNIDRTFDHLLTHTLPLMVEAVKPIAGEESNMAFDMTKDLINNLNKLQRYINYLGMGHVAYGEPINMSNVERELAKIEMRRMDHDLY